MERIGNFTRGVFLLGRKPEEEWFWWFKPFLKLRAAFRGYWMSIKIKINITCVSKEYEIKTKMEQEQWLQLKILFLLGYNLKTVVWWGDWYLVRWRSLLGEIFLGGEGANFQMVEKNLCMGGKALPLLPHSQYICWKYIIEDRENPQPYSIF